MLPAPLRTLLRLAAFGAVYFLAARLGLYLVTFHQSVSPVWPASGVAVAGLRLLGPRFWPAVLVGAFLANWLTPTGVAISLGIAVGNSLEAVAGAWIVGRVLASSSFGIRHQRLVIAFAAAAVFAPALSAVGGVFALGAGGGLPLQAMGSALLTWWVGDALGLLVIGPVVELSRRRSKVEGGKPILDRSVAVLLAGFVGYTVFLRSDVTFLLFAAFPVVLWASTRLAAREALVVTIGLAAMSTVGAALGLGPFQGGTINQNLICMQLFVASLAITTLTLIGLREAGRMVVPAMALLLTWLLGAGVFAVIERSEATQDARQFERIVERASERLRARLGSYEDAMMGGVALIAASRDVDRAEWQTYVSTFRLLERYPGVNGMGLIQPVRRSDELALVRGIRRSGVPDFRVRLPIGAQPESDPSHARRDRYLITVIEPIGMNGPALGLDIGAEDRRREAADRARDTGQHAITRRIFLAQRSAPGFLLLIPYYRAGARTETVAQRRLAHRGWVYVPFSGDQFFSAFGGNTEHEVEFSVYDAKPESGGELIYASTPTIATDDRVERWTELEVGSDRMFLAWKRSPTFVSSHDTLGAWVAGLAALVSLLVAGIVVGLQRSRLEMQERVEAKRAASESRIREEAFRQTSELKSRFLANVGHEMRTPLHGVAAMIELMGQGPLDATQRQRLETARLSSRTLLSVINDLLDFSKIESGRSQLDVVEFRLSRLIRDLAQTWLAAARGTSRPDLVLDLGIDEGARYLGDPNRVGQVLTNLVSNAMKFSPDGQVRVSVRPLDAGTGVRIEVADDGIGIPEHAQEGLFQAFAQADAGVARRFGGTGLGLSIARGWVERMGGRIGFRSQVGEGSTFWVELPLTPVEASGSAPAVRPGAVDMPRLNCGRVLVVEDNEVNREVALAQLAALGVEAEAVANAEAAVARLESAGIDAVLMDCQMPDVDGYEATRRIRQREARTGRRVAVIAMTASVTAGDRERCLAAGMDDYLAKPTALDALVEALRRWLPAAVPPAIDPAVLARLRNLPGGGDLVRRLAGIYAKSASSQVAELRAAAKSGDRARLGALAHALRSTSANLGARRVTEFADRLERWIAAGRGTPAEVDEVVGSIEVASVEAHRELERAARAPS